MACSCFPLELSRDPFRPLGFGTQPLSVFQDLRPELADHPPLPAPHGPLTGQLRACLQTVQESKPGQGGSRNPDGQERPSGKLFLFGPVQYLRRPHTIGKFPKN